LPIQRELAVLFVDIADSTRTVVRQPLEAALVIVQRFTRLVTEIALTHCGDVKDYEGDGAMLYFRSVEQAARAALAIRAALAAAREKEGFSLQARLSINVGDVIIGEIGSPMRRSVTLIGPMIHVAARLLKHIPPGGIIAPQAVVERLRGETPPVASQFQLLGPCLILRGFEEECITAYHIPPLSLATQHYESRSVNEDSLKCNNSVIIS
jgi:class 3 adenylate cyclase